MERRKFEDSFQEVFKDAEMDPSENVWTNIELDLERANGDMMKRRIIFFKMLAAASVVFALCAGGLTYFIFSDNQASTNIAEQKIVNEMQPGKKEQGTALESPNSPQTSDNATDRRTNAELADGENTRAEQRSAEPSTNLALAPRVNTEGRDEAAIAGNDVTDQIRTQPSVAQDNLLNKTAETSKLQEQHASNRALDNNDNNLSSIIVTPVTDDSNLIPKNDSDSKILTRQRNANERKLPAFYEPALPELEFPTSTADPGMVLLARLADQEKEYSRDQKTKVADSEKLWTSVGFAAGAFAANNPNVTPPPSNSFSNMTANTLTTAAKQSRASGTSYSLGVSLGTKISERWIVQGGVNYLTQSSDYTANSVIIIDNNYSSLKAESINAFTAQIADASAQPKVAQTFPYNVNNNVRFVSVPIQAGYLLLNRKFGVQLNAGVSTDLFLQNTITPDGGGVTKTTQGRGEDSPYRSLNFSGLMGTELSYKLGSRYRVSINPALRYPFKSVYKDNIGIDATPLTFDVGLRFRYIFH